MPRGRTVQALGQRVAGTGQIGAYAEPQTISDALHQGFDDVVDTAILRFEHEKEVNESQRQLDEQDEQDRIGLGYDESEWAKMPAEEKSVRLVRRAIAAGKDKIEVDYGRVGEDIQGALRTSQNRLNALLRNADPNDAKKYRLMCPPAVLAPADPETGAPEFWFTPEPRQIPLVDINQKLIDGWTRLPRYPFLPEPSFRCPIGHSLIYGVSSARCPYIGRSDDEVDTHMTFTHPLEKQTRERVLTDQRLQAELDERRAARQATERQTDVMMRLLERGVAVPEGA